jgi:hypothetical protein
VGSLLAARRKKGEQSEDRLPVLEGDFPGFAAVAAVPAECGPAELLWCLVADKEDELERLREANVGGDRRRRRVLR